MKRNVSGVMMAAILLPLVLILGGCGKEAENTAQETEIETQEETREESEASTAEEVEQETAEEALSSRTGQDRTEFLPDEYEKIYDAIEQGDWSYIEYLEEVEYLLQRSERIWAREDINGDGTVDLIGLYDGEEVAETKKKPIEFILTYDEGAVYAKFIKEYGGEPVNFYLCKEGKLLFEEFSFGDVTYVIFSTNALDENWDMMTQEVLTADMFLPDEFYEEYSAEGTIEAMKESFPDTYGANGPGVYCFNMQQATEEAGVNEEYIEYEVTLEEMVARYNEITGYDFIKDNAIIYEMLYAAETDNW